MDNATLLNGLIRIRPPDESQIQRQRKRLTLFLILWSIISVLIPIAIGAFALWHTWQTNQWGDFWNGVFLFQIGVPTVALLQPTIHISIYLYHGRRSKEWSAQAQHLRQAAREGDTALAPLADKQYEPLSSSPLSAGLQHWGPLKQPPEEKIEWMLAIGIFLSLLGGVMSVVLIPGGSHPLDTSTRVAGVVGLLLLAVGVGALAWWYWGMRKDIDVLADDRHLEWKRLRWWGRTRTTLDWQEIHTFFTFTYDKKRWGGLAWEKFQVYVLDGHRATLAWVVPEYPKAYERDIHAPFCRLISARTRLPLRDLSAAVEELEKQAPDSRRDWIMRKTQQHDQAVLASFRALPKPVQKPSRRVFALLLAPLLAFGLVTGAAWGLQIYQAHQYAQMLAQIRTHKPLYHDALTAPDGDWKFQNEPQSTYDGTYTYANGSYQLTGGYFMVALEPHTFGDVAVEVTVRLSGTADALKYDSVGLAFQANSPYDAMIFEVGPDGFWSIGPVTGVSSDLHNTGAFNATPGAPNHLAIIIRGNQYICFANGQLVGIYQNKQGYAGHVGVYHLGAYNESDQSVAAFNDFTVYPLA
jgi:hypothetical protein